MQVLTLPAMLEAAQAPAQLLFYRLSEPGLAAPTHWLQGQ